MFLPLVEHFLDYSPSEAPPQAVSPERQSGLESGCSRPYGVCRCRVGALAWRYISISDSTARASDFAHGLQKMATSDPGPEGLA